MESIIEERAVKLGEYIVENKATIRRAAKEFGICKSTVYKDVAKNLKYISPALAKEVRKVLDYNKAERAMRGGMALVQKRYATKLKSSM